MKTEAEPEPEGKKRTQFTAARMVSEGNMTAREELQWIHPTKQTSQELYISEKNNTIDFVLECTNAAKWKLSHEIWISCQGLTISEHLPNQETFWFKHYRVSKKSDTIEIILLL